jgi:hypothetical protein
MSLEGVKPEMKTCITAPEPIEYGQSVIFGAYRDGCHIFIMGRCAYFTTNAKLTNPSPTLLAFIERAKRELAPLKECGLTVGEFEVFCEAMWKGLPRDRARITEALASMGYRAKEGE